LKDRDGDSLRRIRDLKERVLEIKFKLRRPPRNIVFRELLLQEMLQLERIIEDLEDLKPSERGRLQSELRTRSSRPRRAPDKRKAAIAEIKRANPNMTAREICKAMDGRAPSDRELQPPKGWETPFWVRAYQQSPAKVRTYISKIKNRS
jgi:hypothetical protein